MGRILLIAAGATLVVMLVLVAALRLLAPDGRDAAPQPRATVAATATPAVVVTAVASATPETGASEAGAADEAAATTSAPEPASMSEPASSSGWTRVSTLSGTGQKQSPHFRLRGDRQKLTWTLGANSFPVALIDVVPGDEAWFDDPGDPEASPSRLGSGSKRLRVEPGEYYLYVFSQDCTWKVTMWDRR